MLTDFRVGSAVLAAVAVAAVSSARADSGQATRAVIRGTGSDVELVYQAPAGPSRSGVLATPSSPVDEALRMAAAGADDRSVVAYLRRHQADLPGVIDASVLQRFRKAGAGESVVQFLSAHAAVDIGLTAEDASSPSMPPGGETAFSGGAYDDAVEAGYPFYGSGGGYGASGYSGNGRHGRIPARPIFHRGVLISSHAFEFFRPSPPRTHPIPMHPSVPGGRPRMMP